MFWPCPATKTLSKWSQDILSTPRRGRIIIFYSLHPSGETDEYSLHAGCEVKSGIKWSANKWSPSCMERWRCLASFLLFLLVVGLTLFCRSQKKAILDVLRIWNKPMDYIDWVDLEEKGRLHLLGSTCSLFNQVHSYCFVVCQSLTKQHHKENTRQSQDPPDKLALYARLALEGSKGVMAVNDHTMPMMPTQEMTEIGEEKMLQMLKAPTI